MTAKNIVVFGLGYVGLSNAILLARHHHVTAIDIDSKKVEMVNARISPIVDKEISECLNKDDLDLVATMEISSVSDADYVIVATPTNYDVHTKYFDTSSVEEVVSIVNTKSSARLPLIIIKSTIPIGFISGLKEKGFSNVIFMPEFLREGKALYDNLYPSRIVVGEKSSRALEVAKLYRDACLLSDVPIVQTGSTEAEAVKLFANTKLAMRVAYFNELDTFAEMFELNARDIIEGVTLDPRIGVHYRNPSFGYGGYCLPKDTKQLLANYTNDAVPQKIIEAIVSSNMKRFDWVVEQITRRHPQVVGLYRLVMKSDSDNFRSSAMLEILNRLKTISNIRLIIYEPTITSKYYEGVEVCNILADFKNMSDLICANRTDENLSDVTHKLYSRDVFHSN